MENFTSTLLLAGLLAGLVNFFANYINLPFSKPSFEEDSTGFKDVWWIAVIGYLIIGCTGSFLTPLMNALIGGLKGLYTTADATHPEIKTLDKAVLFGYGIVFGYSTTRLLVGLLDSLIKKISTLELRLKQLQVTSLENKFVPNVGNNVTDIINE